jgi:site-specific recombinase XerD
MKFLEEKGIGFWGVVGLRDLQHFMAELGRRGIKPSSMNRKAHAIKTFFKFLKQSAYISENPAAALIPPSVPRKEQRFLTEEEYQRLLAQVNSARDRAIIMVFLQTGIRRSELARLTTYDLELPRRITKNAEDVGTLKLRRKRGKEESIPLNYKACEALAVWLKERKQIVNKKGLLTDALFLNRYGAPMTPRGILNLVKKYLDQAGIKGASVHTLRHTMATHYLAKGGDLRSVQEMLGHESIETTQGYLGLAKKVQKRMVQDFAL